MSAAAASEDPGLALQALLERIVGDLGLDAEVRVRSDGQLISGEVIGEDLGPFIGRHGQTIDAVRHLAQRIILRGDSSSMRIEIDADGYRERRAESLRALADDAAAEALRIGRPVSLEPMPPSERRIVHEHLRDYGGVVTRSDGAEPRRHLVVVPGSE